MTKSLRHIVPARTLPQRLDRYLTAVLPGFSRSQIQKLISQGHVSAKGRQLKRADRVSPGEEFLIVIRPPAPLELKPEAIPLRLIYEDHYLLVVDKPAGLVVHPAPGHSSGTLVHALLAHGTSLSSLAGTSKPGIVHRLDKETSGILLVAKDDQTHRMLSEQFARRTVHRVYLALVEGVLLQERGTITLPIGRDPFHRQRMSVRYGVGREAITDYHVLKRFSKMTFLELKPQTGRTHQLRVHLAHLGHPILGDPRYGSTLHFPRQALHANRLGFEHPYSRRWMELTSPLPPDLSNYLHQLQ